MTLQLLCYIASALAGIVIGKIVTVVFDFFKEQTTGFIIFAWGEHYFVPSVLKKEFDKDILRSSKRFEKILASGDNKRFDELVNEFQEDWEDYRISEDELESILWTKND